MRPKIDDDGTTFFKFPEGCVFVGKDGKRTAISSVRMREITGDDEEYAANRAKARGGSISTQEVLVALSLVEVNEKAVTGTTYDVEFGRWNSRARQYAGIFYNALNGASKDEADAFLAMAAIGPVSSDSPAAK